jgi:hypothetical protein
VTMVGSPARTSVVTQRERTASTRRSRNRRSLAHGRRRPSAQIRPYGVRRYTAHAELSASRRGRASRPGDLGLAAWSSRLGGPFEHPCPDRASGRVLRESVSPESPATHMSVTQAVLRSAAGALAGASSVHLDAESLDDTDGLHDASADVQRKRAFSDALVSRRARVVPDRRAGGRCYERTLRSPVRISLMRISGCSRAAKCPPLSASP